MCEIINYAPSGASKTGQDMDRTSARENIRSAAAEMSGPLVKVSGPLSKCQIEWEVIIMQQAFDMNRESAEYEHSVSSSATPVVTRNFLPHPSTIMPSPKKSRGKRKGQDFDNGPPAGRVKNTQTPRTGSVEATNSRPTLPDELSGPRCSGRPNAGTGGRNAQLEKLETVFESLSRKRSLKGSTSFNPDIPRNPQAPEPRKACKSKKNIAPPPYPTAEMNSMDVSESQRDVLQPPSIMTPGTKLNLQPLDNPYATAMVALPRSTAPLPVMSAQLEPGFSNASQRTYQSAALTTFPEHSIDPALRTQASSIGANSEDSGSDESSACDDTEEEDEGVDRDADIGNWGAPQHSQSGMFNIRTTAKEYEPIYKEMMEMIQIILMDEYHGPKLIKQLEEWAAYGW
ncbi:uncharacterized protein HD556DRAFT_1308940 [Suillus plorans]|uniref:Uncharacterized protein n=1 Tax=Suillus plorans TaxID=116603 RepID=A0A9P7DHC6_9AGAM|nr:uncharacterized protein HD556DRAFT_1308940 [Suillus plorans]KAG1792905.1 hypothetical protein HD556DRAFT_1308940 [Suillus plorans]